MINRKFINLLTTICGFTLIILGPYSVFVLEKVTWWDAAAAVLMGILLIYTKNSSAVDKLIEVIKK